MKLKAALGIVLTLLLIGILTLAFGIQPVEAELRIWTVDDDGPAHFQTIQKAINEANPGDTIYVYNGTYHEHLTVNKSISLIGESKENTVIDGCETGTVIHVNTNNVTISGFEIRNSSMLWGDWGILLNHSSNNIVDGNIVKAVDAICVEGGSGNYISDNRVVGLPHCCVFTGLELMNSSNNVVTGNYLSFDCHNAFTMHNSNHNYIAFNYISGHFVPFPFTISKSHNNSIVGNTIWQPHPHFGGHIYFTGSCSNVLYYNSFLADEGPITMSIDEVSMNNTWDDGYPSGGNYWSDYADRYPDAEEIDDLGIWDTPYVIDEANQDSYPLMNSPRTPEYTLTIHSSPTGVTFTVIGRPETSPWDRTFVKGTFASIVMPETHDGYVWSQWLEDGDTNKIKTVIMNTNITLTAKYVSKPTGGITLPINKPTDKHGPLTPWIWLSTIILPMVATAIFVKHAKHRRKK